MEETDGGLEIFEFRTSYSAIMCDFVGPLPSILEDKVVRWRCDLVFEYFNSRHRHYFSLCSLKLEVGYEAYRTCI